MVKTDESIVVTGGAGFIGSHLCEALLNNDFSVICIDDFSDYYSPRIKRHNISGLQENPRFRLIEADVCKWDELVDAVDYSDVDCIVHLAARPGVTPSVSDPSATFRNNVIGTHNILELCRRKQIEQLVLASSSSVYGSRRSGPFRETDPVNHPESPYAASKVMNEAMAHAYHSSFGLRVSCLRFFTVYGPRQRPDMAIHTFVRKILTTGKLDVYGSPDSSRDYTYVDDIVDGIMRVIRHPFDFTVLNLGCSHPVRLGDLVELIVKEVGIDVEIAWRPTRAGDVPLTHADISRARDTIGYSPRVSIEQGVRMFIEWYRKVAKSGIL
ncbi:MAG: GDP-mannose 4,6-dehydratase [Candidatus Thorarchaeota archaeon]